MELNPLFQTMTDKLITLLELIQSEHNWRPDDIVVEQFYDHTPDNCGEFEQQLGGDYTSYIHFVTPEDMIINSTAIIRTFKEMFTDKQLKQLGICDRCIVLLGHHDGCYVLISPNHKGFVKLDCDFTDSRVTVSEFTGWS